jgi:hypothetical protein
MHCDTILTTVLKLRHLLLETRKEIPDHPRHATVRINRQTKASYPHDTWYEAYRWPPQLHQKIARLEQRRSPHLLLINTNYHEPGGE